MAKPHAVFLLGAGASIGASLSDDDRMPKTDEITERILKGKDVVKHSDDRYYHGPTFPGESFSQDNWTPRVKLFISRLGVRLNEFFQSRCYRHANYEDVFYVVNSLYDYLMSRLDDPIVHLAYSELRNIMNKALIIWPDPDFQYPDKQVQLARETLAYINDLLIGMLEKLPSQLSGLHYLCDASRDEDFEAIDIFTLNYDRILERLFNSELIKFVDGFPQSMAGICRWDPSSFDNSSTRIRLLKLHGSIDWYPIDGGIGRPEIGKNWDELDEMRQIRYAPHRPLILVGTLNKTFAYVTQMYSDLICRFHPSFFKANTIIIHGYGFGDEGLNKKIFGWMDHHCEMKLVIIDIDEHILERNQSLVHLEKQNRIVLIPAQKDRPLSWEEIKEHL